MAPEAMMAVGGLVVSPLGLHEHTRLPQDVEQLVSSDLHLHPSKVCTQQTVQLAGTEARLAKPDRLHQCHYRLGLLLKVPFSLATLVIGLAADAHVAASPLYAQSFDLTTRDSLPEDFFTVTPCSSHMILTT